MRGIYRVCMFVLLLVKVPLTLPSHITLTLKIKSHRGLMFNKILKYVQAMEKNAILFLVHHRSNINQSIIHYIPHLVKGS